MNKITIWLILFFCVTACFANIKVCFTPQNNCRQLIVNTINQAKHQILVQAYEFTDKKIAKALIAETKHGIKVIILIDSKQIKSKKSVTNLLLANHIKVISDYISGIAHNKIMIIDDGIVITGSYNFTNAAQFRNAENLLVIQDKQIVSDYITNWRCRYEKKY